MCYSLFVLVLSSTFLNSSFDLPFPLLLSIPYVVLAYPSTIAAMHLSTILPTALLIQAKLVVSYVDSRAGQGLLGSHFGIPFFKESFDYVVVGDDTAGLALATRLAQNNLNSVAVIEAGGWSEFGNGNLTAIPADSSRWIGKSPTERNPLIEWEICTEPMPDSRRRQPAEDSHTLTGGVLGVRRSSDVIYSRNDPWRWERTKVPDFPQFCHEHIHIGCLS